MSNLINHPKRILEISDDFQMITLPDSRYYKRNGEYYPSITYILGCYPKGKFFEDWLKKVGYSADYLVQKAAEEGTQVHNLVEKYLKGEKMEFLDKNSSPKYDIGVWKMFLKFVEFWETHKPKLIETEVHLFSDKYKVAGTCDLICEIDGVIWVIDLKTSNQLYVSYELQTAIYGQCYHECFGVKPKKYGILWLKSSKRKPRKDFIQGKGWELAESKRTFDENLELFEAVQKIFNIENPVLAPSFTEFKTTAHKID